MKLRTTVSVVVTVWALLISGCKDAGRDRPASGPQEGARPAAAEPPATEPGGPPPSSTTTAEVPPVPAKKKPAAPAEKKPAASAEPSAEDFRKAVKEIAALEREARFSDAINRVREMLETYRGRPEARELSAHRRRLYKYRRDATGLAFALRKLSSDSPAEVSVATDKLLGAGEVGLIFLRKAVRQAEPDMAAHAARLLVQQQEPSVTGLMIARMEQDPAESLSDDLADLLRGLEAIEPEQIARLCALARLEGPSRAGAVRVVIDRLERSIRTQLGAANPEQPEPVAVKVDENLVRALCPVALTTAGPLQQRAVEALLLVLGEVSRRDGEAFNKLLANEEAYSLVNDYVLARLDSEKPADRFWAIARAATFRMRVPGLWAQIRSRQAEQPDEGPVLNERLDPALNFGDINALRRTGHVEKGQAIRWTGFLNVPAEGEYKFSVECDETNSPASFFVDEKQTSTDKPVELSAGWHEVRAEMNLSGDLAQLYVHWEGPGLAKQHIPPDRLASVDRTRMLIWKLGRNCDLVQADNLARQLVPSVQRIDKELTEKLIALVQADRPVSPAAMPAAEVLARVLRRGHLDDTFEKTLCENLWPFVEESAGERQRTIVGALVTKTALFGNDAVEYDKAMKVEGAFLKLRDFVAARLDDKDAKVAAWAMDHTNPFGLYSDGLWIERLAGSDGPPVNEFLQTTDLNFADLNAVMSAGKAKQGEAIRWIGYLKCPSAGPYVFTVDAGANSPVAMKVAGEAIEFGKPIELAAGTQPIDILVTIGADAKLVFNWQQPGQTQPALISRSSFTCPAWAKLLVWQLQQEPELEQAEEICSHLARMSDQIDQSLVALLLPLIKPEAPLVLPVAELVAGMLPSAHLDDNFEKTLPEHLFPLVKTAEGKRQRAIVTSLVGMITTFFSNNSEQFDTAAKVEGAFRSLGDLIIARLDDEDTDVAAWAVNHSSPFGLGYSGLWLTRFASADGPAVREQLFAAELNYADLAAVLAATGATQGQAIRWTGLLRCPSDGPYVFTIAAGAGSPAAMNIGGQAIESGKPIELTAGLHAAEITLTIGADAKLVIQWKQPGGTEAAMLHANSFMCPAWAKSLVWQLQQEPELARAEEICARLNCMVDRISQPLAEQLPPLIAPDSPIALPVAEVMASVLQSGPMDEAVRSQFAGPLWPLIDKTTDERQRVIAGALVWSTKLFANKSTDFDAAMKVDGAYETLRKYVAVRLDSKEAVLAGWAMDHTGPFGLGHAALWVEKLASPGGPAVRERYLASELNFGDRAGVGGVLPVNIGEAIRWTGFLRCPRDGAYLITIEAAPTSPVEMTVAGQAIESGKPIELAQGTHPIEVQLTIGPDAKLVVNWQQPGSASAELINRGAFACPAWANLLVWQLQQKPTAAQAETICARLSRMADQIDHTSLGPQLLAMIGPDAPFAPPVAEVLAHALHDGHLDDTFEKTLPEHLWPLVATTDGQRQQAIVGSLVATLERLFANNGPEFEKVAKAEGAFLTLRDFVAERLDAKEADVASWAMDHTGPFGLSVEGLWTERLAAPDGPPVSEHLHNVELNLGDLNAVMGAGKAKQGEAIRWTGYLKCPSYGPYVFTVSAGAKSPVVMKVAGKTVEFGKPIELPAGTQPIDVHLTIGPDAKLVLNWQQPGSAQPVLIPRASFVHPIWPTLLAWQLQQGPDATRAEAVCSRLARMIDRIDDAMATELLALVEANEPVSMPVAELLSRRMSLSLVSNRQRTEFDAKLMAKLRPLCEQAEDGRQRVLVGTLADSLEKLYGKSGEQLDADAAAGAAAFVHDFIAERLDADQLEVAQWALRHAGAVELVLRGLWARTYTKPGPAGKRFLLDERLDGQLQFADPAALNLGLAKRIRWDGYLDVPTKGAYTFTVDSGEQVAIRLGGEKVEPGKAIELPAGLLPLVVGINVTSTAPKLVLSWQRPDGQPEVIPAGHLICPDRLKLLLWEMTRSPQQAEAIARRLGLMIERIGQPQAEQLLALVKDGSPLALPAAGLLAQVLHRGHLDDGFEQTLAEHLWPAVAKTDGRRQRVLVGALVRALERFYSKSGEEFDKAVKVEGAFRTLRDFVAERLDAKELTVRLWAAEHAEPFALLGAGLEGSYFDKDFNTRLFDRVDTQMQFEPGQFAYPDKRTDNMGIRWSGLIRAPADGKYTFSCVADDSCRLWLDGRPVIQDPKKPATGNLTAGLHEIRVEYVETTGPERLVVYWQPPGQGEPQVLAGELKHVDLVKLLVDRLVRRPDDPQAAAWLQELGYKADRLTDGLIAALNKLAQQHAAWQGPLANMLAAVVLRDSVGAPAPAKQAVAQYAPTLKGPARRRAVEALLACLDNPCGGDKVKFQQLVGSDKTFDFLCEEVKLAAESTDPSDAEWALEKTKLLQLKLAVAVPQGEDGRMVLLAKTAALNGNRIKYEEDKDSIGSWTDDKDYPSWRMTVRKGGTFAVSLTWSCAAGNENGEFVIGIGTEQLAGKVAATGDLTKFQTVELGKVKLDAGTHELTVKAKAIPSLALMNLKSVTLAPAN